MTVTTSRFSLSSQEKFEKDKKILREYLRTSKYFNAEKAMDFAEPYHPGVRKDGVTPAFHHQVQMAFSAYNIRHSLRACYLGLPDGEGSPIDRLIALMFTHDTYEDNQHVEIGKAEKEIGPQGVDDMIALSKIKQGKRLPNEVYYPSLIKDPILIIGKLLDRKNNFGTIYELPDEKQRDYLGETEHLIETAKSAMREHPQFTSVIYPLREDLKRDLGLYAGSLFLNPERRTNITQGLRKAGFSNLDS